MAEITNEMLYAEMLKLDEQTKQTLESLEDLVRFMKDMNRELAEGQARTDALKKRLFGDRFDQNGAILG